MHCLDLHASFASVSSVIPHACVYHWLSNIVMSLYNSRALNGKLNWSTVSQAKPASLFYQSFLWCVIAKRNEHVNHEKEFRGSEKRKAKVGRAKRNSPHIGILEAPFCANPTKKIISPILSTHADQAALRNYRKIETSHRIRDCIGSRKK